MVLPLIFGALAPGLLAGTGMSSLMAASLGAGVGGAIQSGDLETGLLTGLGAFAGGSLLGPMMGGAGGAGASAATNAATGAATGAKAGTAAAAAAAPSAAQPGGLMSLMRGPAPGSTASMLGTAAAPAGAGAGMIPNAINFAKSGVGTGVGIGAMAGPALKGVMDGMSSKDGKSKYSGPGSKEMKPLPVNANTPGSDYQPGVSPEFDYGIGRVPSAGQIIDFRDTGALRYSDGGLLRRYQQMLGPVKMAAGGIASLAEEDQAMMAQAPQGGGNEKDVINEAVKAIKGESQNAEVALAAFLTAYGEDALRDLVDRVQSGELDQTIQSSTGKLQGPGDGMEDMIPATIEGQQDVLLSDGEYVIPADVVSGLGNGSSEAGSRTLDEMAARVRQSRTGTTEQPARVPKEAMLPV